MGQLGYILATGAIVYLVNCMPALGPPTWAVLVGAELSWGIPEIVLIPVGALAATAGRLTLATGFGAGVGSCFPPNDWRELKRLARQSPRVVRAQCCLLYTSDAADE